MGAFRNRRRLVATTALISGTLLSAFAGAATAQPRTYNIPAESLSQALRDYGRQTGQQLIFTEELVRGRQAPAVKGQFEPPQALSALLSGSGLRADTSPSGVLMIVRDGGPPGEAAAGAASEPAQVSEVTVTGTNIRGAAPSSPVMTFRPQDISEAGYSNLGELIRSIPQNFSGGQNPGEVSGASGRNPANQNASGGSALNLRGLGPDATLTLVNGHRLSYDGLSQAVDISSIPIAAIERMQIVADGASAIYGSDAVAGVANVILKRDMEGITASARLGGATDGGDSTTQTSLTLGERWSSGGVLFAGQYDHNTPISTDDRKFTKQMLTPNYLLPDASQWSGVLSIHQQVGSKLELSVDVLGSERRRQSLVTYPSASYSNEPKTKSFALAPNLRLDAPGGWVINLGGVVAANRNVYSTFNYTATGALLSYSHGCYCNRARQAEVSGEGPIFTLPGGEARMAAGGGYRRNTYQDPGDGGSISSRYAFGEVNLPLIAPEMDIPGARRLALNGAVRYEKYDTLGQVTTPKVGIVYNPFDDLQLRASWGKSFKAPTLVQQYQVRYIAVFPANFFDPSVAADQQALVVGGGSRQLKPETANSFTGGFVYKPHSAPGLRFEMNYFDIDYTDRVISPIADFTRAFTDPSYVPYIVRNPTQAQIQAERARAGLLYTLTGPYDPNKVIAIIDDSSQNAARQRIKGVDVDARYEFPFAGGNLTASATGSWMRLTQQNSQTAPTLTLTGTPFNPPKFRARGGLTWRRDNLSLAGFVNRQSSMIDTGLTPPPKVKGQTTLDLTGLYRFGFDGPLHDLELGVSVLNVTNEQPPFVRGTVSYVPAFDSTNYSAVGRYISVSLTKHW